MIINYDDQKEFKNIKRKKEFLLFLNIIFVLSLITVIYVSINNFDLSFESNSFKNNFFNTNFYYGPECANLTFQKTAICLNDFVREIYIYNITDDDIDLNLDDLITRGGDCRDWTNFYEEYMNYYGYNQTQKVKMFVYDENRTFYYHVFLVASHSSGYCNFDLENLECYQYRNNRGEIRE